ncbi:hypothetical protein QYM36_008319 [Artemia franciscana]|uniref:C-type lectin domain-containing protein n=1 Tax=Artemia franciscana TaxID=6661 RepID=A0AA88LME4_ARTSF|nr:hypothetical protein QYM36_008319 [Artemia franciscana]
MEKCLNTKVQKSHKCIANQREKCKCITFFQQPLERNEALKICQKMNGTLADSSFNKELEELFLDYWRGASGNSFNKNTEIMFQDNKSAVIDWSNGKKPVVSIKTTSNEKQSFICKSDLEDEYSKVDWKEMEKCLNTKVQKSHKCIANQREKCKCITFFQQPLERNEAVKICQKMNGTLADSSLNKELEELFLDYWRGASGNSFNKNTEIMFQDNKSAVIDWSNGKKPVVSIKTTSNEKQSFICKSDLEDEYSKVDWKEMEKCLNTKVQKSHKCIANQREKCKCITFFQQPLERNEAVKICQKMNGTLADSSLNKELEELFLDYWRGASGNSFNKNTEIMFQDNKSAVIDWSNGKKPVVSIKTTSNEKQSFICKSDLEDEYSKVDWKEMEKCLNTKVQKSHKCIANQREKCKCITFFQQPLERNEAVKICQKMNGTLADSSFNKELEELFLDYWRGASENSFNKNTEIMFQDNKSAVIDWSNGKKPVVSIKTTSKEKESFICESNIEDDYSHIDWDEMKKCLNKKIQKSHQCIANPREKCKCLTFFEQPLEGEEALQICQQMKGTLADSSFNKELEELFLDYWRGASGNSFNKNTEIMFQDNKSAVIDWSNGKKPVVSIKTTSNEKQSFICKSDLEDEYSKVDWKEMEKCLNTKVQKSHKCIANQREKCKCITFFQQPLERNEAVKICQKMNGTLADSSLNKELEELFLDYWRGASGNSFNKNTEIMFQDNKSAVIDWSNGKKPVVSIKTTSNEKQSFICKSDLEDEYSKVDWKEMEKCLNTKVQKSHKCIANQREKCKCITFFQQPLERNEAVKICQKMNGTLADSSFNKELEELFLDYWRGASGNSFNKNTEIMFQDNKSAVIDWSNGKKPVVSIKTTSNEKQSFICKSDLEDEYSKVDWKEMEKCLNTKVQKSHKCIANQREKCKCITFFQQPLERNEAVKICQKMNGTLADSSFNKELEELFLDYWRGASGNSFNKNTEIMFQDNKSAVIDWSNGKKPVVSIKTTSNEKQSFICKSDLEDEYSKVDWKEMEKCLNTKVQKSHKCIANQREKCKCITFFQQPLERNEAVKICQKMNGTLADSSFNKELEELFLDYWRGASGNSFNKNTEIMFQDNKSAVIDWSNGKKPVVSIKTTSNEKQSFICKSDLEDEYSKVDWKEMEKCLNTKVQKSHKCIANQREKCKCITFFQQPLERNEAVKICQKMNGTLADSSFNKELEELFLDYWRGASGNSFNKNTEIMFQDNKSAVIDWSNGKKPVVSIKTTSNEKQSFICKSDLEDEYSKVDWKEMEKCLNTKVQKSHKCIANQREKCKCITFFQQPLERNEAVKICQKMNGTLADSSFNKELEELFLDYWRGASGNSFNKNTEIMFQDNKSAVIDWSNGKKPVVSIKTTSNEKQSFICKSDLEDEYSKVDWKEMEKCLNTKVQKSHKCIANQREKCKCITFFQQPLERNEAVKICQKMNGTLADSSFNKELEELFLDYWRGASGNSFNKNTEIMFQDNKSAVIDWSNGKKPVVSIKTTSNEKQSFICKSDLEDEYSKVDWKEMEKCLNTKVQKSHKCIANQREKCKCITFFQQPLERNEAVKICQKMNGTLADSSFNKELEELFLDYWRGASGNSFNKNTEIMFQDNKSAVIDWSNGKKPVVSIKTTSNEKQSFICKSDLEDEYSKVDWKEMEKCLNTKVQKSHKCIANQREKCKCITFFQQPLERNEAVKICQKMNGTLADSSLNKGLEELFLDYWRGASGNSFNKNTEIMFQDNKSAVIDWSNGKKPVVSIKTTSNEKQSFICKSDLEDEYSKVDWKEMETCLNTKLQKSHKCIANQREKCKCITFFQQPLERNEAVKICQKMNGTLADSSFNKELEELFLDYWRGASGNSFNKNTEIMFQDNKSAVIDWSNGKKPVVSIKTTSNEKQSFICKSDLEDEYSKVDWKEMKKCLNTKVQKSHKCIANQREKCKCITFFQQPLERNEAVKICQKMNGTLADSSFNKELEELFLDYWRGASGNSFNKNTEIMFQDNKSAVIDWSNGKKPVVSIKTTSNEKQSFICKSDLEDEYSKVDWKEMEKCLNTKVQKSHKCIANQREKCKCITFFQQPLERNEAVKICQKMNGTLADSSFNKELEELFLDYWRGASGNSFNKNTEIMFQDNKSAVIDWSNGKKPVVSIKTTSNEKQSFICKSDLEDEYSKVDWKEMEKCLNTKVQKSHKCIANQREKCKCITFFQQPLERNEAVKICQKMNGTLADSSFNKELEELFLDYWRGASGNSFNKNTEIMFQDNKSAVIDWSNSKKPVVSIKTISNEKQSFICKSDLEDEYSKVDWKEMEKCLNTKVQKSHKCIANQREKCKCITFLQQPLERNEAVKICQKMNGTLADSSFNKELEELFLDYWRGASGNSFNKNTEIMFQDNKSAVIDWSNGKKPVVSIKTTSNEKQSFICKSDLEDEYSKVDWKEMEKCLSTKVQKSHKCIANQREKCKCITFFQQPLERNEAVKICQKMNGTLADSSFNKELEELFLDYWRGASGNSFNKNTEIMFQDNKSAVIDWSNGKKPVVSIKTTSNEKQSFICKSDLEDEYSKVDWKEMEKCLNTKVQKSHKCIANQREKCKCITFFQQPLERNEAVKICQKMNGTLADSSFNKELEELFLDYWRGASGNSFNKNTEIMFQDNKSAVIDWSNGKKPVVSIKTTSNEKQSFICKSDLEDEYSKVDWKEMEKCLNTKVQKSHKCIANQREKCKCITFFQQPLERNEAVKICQKMNGTLADSSFNKELEELFLDYWRGASGNSFNKNTEIMFQDNKSALIDWSNGKKPVVSIKTTSNEKQSFICKSDLEDEYSKVDWKEMEKCLNTKVQKSHKCIANQREKCKCITFFQQPLERNEAVKICQKMNGTLADSSFNKELEELFLDYWRDASGNSFNKNTEIMFQDNKSAVIDWSNGKKPVVSIKTTSNEKQSFICKSDLEDEYSKVDWKEMEKCLNTKVQKSHKCIANQREKCKCITFFQQPLERNEAVKICQKMNGTLADSSFNKELEELFLDYWRGASGKSFNKNTEIMFQDNKSAVIDWSNGKKPVVSIKTTSNEKQSFICKSDLEDEYSKVDWKEMEKCLNTKIQKSHQCIANPREKCKCLTFFQKPLERNEAVKICQKMNGTLADSSFNKELEELFLDYWRGASENSFNKNTEIMFQDNKSAVIDWSNGKKPVVSIKTTSNEKQSFICKSDLEDEYSKVDWKEMEKCLNTKVQKSHKCIANQREKCKCITFFQQPLERNEAVKICQKMNGTLADSSFNKELEELFLDYWRGASGNSFNKNTEIMFQDNKSAVIDWSNGKKPVVSIKTTSNEKQSFICKSDLEDEYSKVDWKEMEKCLNTKVQKSHKCIANQREKCKCITFFQQPLERNEAVKICQKMNGTLADSSFNKELEELFLDYWRGASGNSFNKNTEIMFQDNKSAVIDWSNGKKPVVSIKTTSNEKQSFICKSDLEDEYSKVDWKEMEKCLNTKVQKSHKCIANQREKCKCITFFQQPLERNEAVKICQKMNGTLADSSFNKELEELFLDYWRGASGNSFNKNTEIMFQDNKSAVIDWFNGKKPVVSIKTTSNEKQSFICKSDLEDEYSKVDWKEMEKCLNTKVQKSHKCIANQREKCKCITFFQQPLERNEAVKICQKMNGTLADSSFNKELEELFLDYWRGASGNSFNKNTEIMFQDNKSAVIDWSNGKKPVVSIKTTSNEKQSFICKSDLEDEYSKVDWKEMEKCLNTKVQKSHKCIANQREKCKCITFFQQPLERNEAVKICQKMNGTLADSSFNKELEELFLDYWRGASGKSFNKNTEIMFQDNKSAVIDWSNGKKPVVSIKTTSNEKQSFICKSDLEDEYSKVDWKEMEKCLNTKVQKSHKCIANQREKCKCITFFQQPLERNEAVKICKKMNGTLADSSFNKELEELFLDYWRGASGNSFNKNTEIMFQDNKSAVIDWSNGKKPVVSIKTTSNEKQSFICKSDLEDEYSKVDWKEMKKCLNAKVQKSHKCIANQREKCKCITFFQQPLERKEAVKICKKMNGTLADSSFNKELEELFLDYWRGASRNSFEKNTQIMFQDNKSAIIDWSNGTKPLVNIRTASKEKESFICESEINDDLEHLDLGNIRKCKISRIQKLYNCGDISFGICQCITVFLKPLDSASASRFCSLAGGTLVKSISNEIELFLNHLILRNHDIIKQNPQFILGNDSYADIKLHKEIGARAVIKNSKETKKISGKPMPFLCKTLHDKKKKKIDKNILKIVRIAIDSMSDETKLYRLKMLMNALDNEENLEEYYYLPQYFRVKREFGQKGFKGFQQVAKGYLTIKSRYLDVVFDQISIERPKYKYDYAAQTT